MLFWPKFLFFTCARIFNSKILNGNVAFLIQILARIQSTLFEKSLHSSKKTQVLPIICKLTYLCKKIMHLRIAVAKKDHIFFLQLVTKFVDFLQNNDIFAEEGHSFKKRTICADN